MSLPRVNRQNVTETEQVWITFQNVSKRQFSNMNFYYKINILLHIATESSIKYALNTSSKRCIWSFCITDPKWHLHFAVMTEAVNQPPAQMVIIQPGQREWSTGLCDCCSDMKSCRLFLFIHISIIQRITVL